MVISSVLVGLIATIAIANVIVIVSVLRSNKATKNRFNKIEPELNQLKLGTGKTILSYYAKSMNYTKFILKDHENFYEHYQYPSSSLSPSVSPSAEASPSPSPAPDSEDE